MNLLRLFFCPQTGIDFLGSVLPEFSLSVFLRANRFFLLAFMLGFAGQCLAGANQSVTFSSADTAYPKVHDPVACGTPIGPISDPALISIVPTPGIYFAQCQAGCFFEENVKCTGGPIVLAGDYQFSGGFEIPPLVYIISFTNSVTVTYSSTGNISDQFGNVHSTGKTYMNGTIVPSSGSFVYDVMNNIVYNASDSALTLISLHPGLGNTFEDDQNFDGTQFGILQVKWTIVVSYFGTLIPPTPTITDTPTKTFSPTL